MNKSKIVSKLFLSIFTLFTIISLVLPFSNAKAEEKPISLRPMSPLLHLNSKIRMVILSE